MSKPPRSSAPPFSPPPPDPPPGPQPAAPEMDSSFMASVTAPVKVLAPVNLPKVGDKNAAPTTTAADDLIAAGQRRINVIWEVTQSILAITVTVATLFVAARKVLEDKSDSAAFLLLSNAFFVVISTYITRTNHQKVGGVAKGDGGR